MPPAPLPDDEDERVSALLALRILDTEPEAEFDIFPALASKLFGAPIAAITLVGRDRQWFKASVGLDFTETTRDASICAHAILRPNEALCVPDATKDPRFSDNPLVVGDFGLRFYAGAPILGPSGHPLGSICVIDRVPREVDTGMLQELQRLAVGVGSALKLYDSMLAFRKLALTDRLTGLDNRAGYDRRLQDAIVARDAGRSRNVGLLFLDLDGFKSINDAHGHDVGDAVLREVGRRLRRVVRGGDAISRFGGDEFCVLVADFTDVAVLNALAIRVHHALAEPFHIGTLTVTLRTSIGIATCPADADDPETLTRKADAALYEAKRAGRDTTRFAAGTLARADIVAARAESVAAGLRAALIAPERDPFAFLVQPIFRAESGCLVGFEALPHWPDAAGRATSADELVPAAEAAGLSAQLDRWVLDRACALAAGWPGSTWIAANVSAASFLQGDFGGELRDTLARHGLAPGRLRLEIAESVFARDSEHMRSIIELLRWLGVRVVLDEFGGGQASLSCLREFDFDGIRIARAFTGAMGSDPRGGNFVRAISEMARVLGVEVAAQGVATDDQLRLLRDAKIDFVQGDLLGGVVAANTVSAALHLDRQM